MEFRKKKAILIMFLLLRTRQFTYKNLQVPVMLDDKNVTGFTSLSKVP